MTNETQLQRMEVRRVEDENGAVSSIEPPLDPKWNDFTKLTWQAGVVHAETGLNVKVGAANLTIGGAQIRGVYDVLIGRSLHGACSYRSAWDKLSGAASGASEAKREASA
jgi:hypothetical protein